MPLIQHLGTAISGGSKATLTYTGNILSGYDGVVNNGYKIWVWSYGNNTSGNLTGNIILDNDAEESDLLICSAGGGCYGTSGSAGAEPGAGGGTILYFQNQTIPAGTHAYQVGYCPNPTGASSASGYGSFVNIQGGSNLYCPGGGGGTQSNSMTTDLSGFCSPSLGGQGVGNNVPYGGHPSRCDQAIPWGNRGGQAWGNGSTASSGGGGGAKGAGDPGDSSRGGDSGRGLRNGDAWYSWNISGFDKTVYSSISNFDTFGLHRSSFCGGGAGGGRGEPYGTAQDGGSTSGQSDGCPHSSGGGGSGIDTSAGGRQTRGGSGFIAIRIPVGNHT